MVTKNKNICTLLDAVHAVHSKNFPFDPIFKYQSTTQNADFINRCTKPLIVRTVHYNAQTNGYTDGGWPDNNLDI